MRILFWGIGNEATKRIPMIKSFSDQIEVSAFVDGFLDGQEGDMVWNDFKVISPQRISQYYADYLCILSIHEWKIRERIFNEKLFDFHKIIDFYEVCRFNLLGKEVNVYQEKKLQNIMHPQQVYYAEKWGKYQYLKRNYSYILYNSKYWKANIKEKYLMETTRPIWILWLQGFEHAPEVVKVCARSLEKRLGNKEHIFLLDEDNLSDYIDLPYYIVDKWKKGIISNSHFSDFIRVRLLNTYGGIWIDSTVYFTGLGLPDYLKTGRLFMFSRWLNWRNCEEPSIAANWLISAPRENKMLMILEAMLMEYWKKENRTVDYFFFHMFFTMIVRCFPNEWNQVEVVLRDPAELLNGEISLQFNYERFKYLKKVSDFHKLSYKNMFENFRKDSFWEYISRMEK